MEPVIFLAALVILTPFVLSIWALLRASRSDDTLTELRREVAALRDRARQLESDIAALRRSMPTSEEVRPVIEPSETPVVAADRRDEPVVSEPELSEGQPAAISDMKPAAAGMSAMDPRTWLKGGLERQFGAVLPVWIGGVAIALAGFFLVKYSIENALLGPEMRIVLGVLLGFALLGGARFVGRRVTDGRADRIAQALAGAGLAVLYVSVYAATALYALLPGILGFVALAALTALAVILSLLHGPPIALLGMVGGFLTPALMASGEPAAFPFFSYLFFTFAALMVLIRRKGWWLLAWPAMLFAFGWVLLWILGGPGEGDMLWLGLFLAAIAATVVSASRPRYTQEVAEIGHWRDLFSRRNVTLALNVAAVAGAMVLMAILAFDSAFGLAEWGLFALLAVGAIALAFFDPRLYGFTPWAATAVTAVMLMGWTPQDEALLSLVLAGFGALYVSSGFLLMPSASTPLLWSAFSAASALGYYLIAFFRLTPARHIASEPLPIDVTPSREPFEPLVEAVKETASAIHYGWALLAMGLAVLFFGAAMRAASRLPASTVKEHVIAIYALATSAFVALALFIELDREFLSVAIAAELLAVAWIASKTRIASLRPIAALLGGAFGFLLLPQILLLIQLSLYSMTAIEWYVQQSIPIVDHPAFQLALPAVMFLAAAYILRQAADSLFVRMLEFSALALIALWGFYTTSTLFRPAEDVLFAEGTFLEAGVLTNVLFIFGLISLFAARFFARPAFFQAGALIVFIAFFRVVYFDLLVKNPLWYGGDIVGFTPFDALTLTYMLPVIWSWFAAAEIERQSAGVWPLRFVVALRVAIFVFVFAWISLEIRKLYQGPVLAGPPPGDAEFYSYSVAWLVFGLALLFAGTLKGNQLLRYASLAVILLTVSKVFLLDAENLTGLYRVFSFLGLGLSLLGISYFYGRFVFGGSEKDAAADGTG